MARQPTVVEAVEQVLALATEYSLETRIRRLIASHAEAGVPARTLVMNTATLLSLHIEVEPYNLKYFWTPKFGPSDDIIEFYSGIPILVKDFVADGEVLVGI